jgi:hypothetical protein
LPAAVAVAVRVAAAKMTKAPHVGAVLEVAVRASTVASVVRLTVGMLARMAQAALAARAHTEMRPPVVPVVVVAPSA